MGVKNFLFITDSHFRDDQPVSRQDKAYETQLKKLGRIFEYVHEHNVDAIFHGGDFFNTRRSSHKLVADILNWSKHVQIPIYAVIGNHDVTGYNLDSVAHSGLGVLFEAEALHLLKTQEVFEKERIIFKAVHTSLDFQQNYMFSNEFDNYTRIIISHNYIIPSDTLPFEFIHPKDITTNAHLVLCGHYHVPFEYCTEKTKWINPGPVCRWQISERTQIPNALLLTIEDGNITTKLLPLSDATQVFDESLYVQEKQREKDIQAFVKSLENTTFQATNIEEIIKTAAQTNNLDSSILSIVLARVRAAKDLQ